MNVYITLKVYVHIHVLVYMCWLDATALSGLS